ncbi:MAG: MoxR family ATPase [Planctomycetes bacterium]|nr:MoxR family ATPase [Planctomycetota bacterium]
MELDRVSATFAALAGEVGKVIVGQTELVEGVLVALFAEGSVLIEGVPGLGKTLLVNTLAQAVSCEFKRVQFTPDLMPSDLTGYNVYDMSERRFHFQRGPIFTNLLLADEINRAPPKTQSALLEVMQERQVTVDGEVYPLPPPFLVIGTQNPLEHEGTYPLPEAQVDRFMFKLLVDYPSRAEENAILAHYAAGHDPRRLETFQVQAVTSAADVEAIRRAAGGVIVEPAVVNYITAIVGRTRETPDVSIGASPRGSVNLFLAARTLAACRGRDFVTPDDVKETAPWVLRHRVRLRPEAEIEGLTPDQALGRILEEVEVPRT